MPFLGQPTWDEVDELIAAKDATIKAIEASAPGVLVAWAVRDAEGAQAWVAAWRALIVRYNLARALRSNPRAVPGVAITPGFVWHAILRALRQAWSLTGSITQSVPESPGDLQPLARQLAAEGAKPDFSSVPQPVVPDRDIAMFKAADVVVKAAEGVALNVPPIVIILGLLMLARR